MEIADEILSAANKIQKPGDKRQHGQLGPMMEDVPGSHFTTSKTDQSFRADNSSRIANQLVYLINKFGVPKYLNIFRRFQLYVFKLLGNSLAPVLMILVKNLFVTRLKK